MGDPEVSPGLHTAASCLLSQSLPLEVRRVQLPNKPNFKRSVGDWDSTGGWAAMSSLPGPDQNTFFSGAGRVNKALGSLRAAQSLCLHQALPLA